LFRFREPEPKMQIRIIGEGFGHGESRGRERNDVWIFTRRKENADHCFNDESVNQSIRECDAMVDVSPTRETVREARLSRSKRIDWIA